MISFKTEILVLWKQMRRFISVGNGFLLNVIVIGRLVLSSTNIL